MAQPYEKITYLAMTLDPVHIGTGGYRLGRVDNTIIREPGTNLPKIPGSSIAGVTRAYTAMAIQCAVDMQKLITENVLNIAEYKKMKYQRPQYDFEDKANNLVKLDPTGNPVIKRDKEDKEIYYSCAGKGAEEGDGHCGERDCEVCIPFGFSKKGNSFQGLAQFFDARILFFPVHSMIGPVWMTSPSVLKDINVLCREVPENKYFTINRNPDNKINFGWLMLENGQRVDLDFSQAKDFNCCDICNIIKNKAFVVSDKLFSHIVNDNLEVRTSVAIDPATGAAEEGALYTYEAIPRATVMWFDVVYNRPEYFRINGSEEIKHGKTNGNGWEWVKKSVEKGLPLIEHLGIGGMGTRGMGRMKIYINGEKNGNKS